MSHLGQDIVGVAKDHSDLCTIEEDCEQNNFLSSNGEEQNGSVQLQGESEQLDKSNSIENPSVYQKVIDFIIKNFLPLSLIFGVVFGSLVPWPGHYINHKVTQYLCVVGIFLYSGLFLRTDTLKEALTAFGAVAWGLASILFITSIIGAHLTKLLIFDPENAPNRGDNGTTVTSGPYIGPNEFVTGLQVYMCMPCTISSGVVMVTQLEGNTALALLLTAVANVIGVFTIPVLIKWIVAAGVTFQFDLPGLVVKLSLSMLVPLIVGKLLRFIKQLKTFVYRPRVKLCMKLTNILLLVAISWMKISTTSIKGGLKNLTVASVFVVAGWSIAMHLIFLIINICASFALRLKMDQKKCIIILASAKTAAVAIPVVALLPPSLGDPGLMAIGIIVAHLTVILLDAVLIAFYLKYEKKKQQKSKAVISEDEKIVI